MSQEKQTAREVPGNKAHENARTRGRQRKQAASTEMVGLFADFWKCSPADAKRHAKTLGMKL